VPAKGAGALKVLREELEKLRHEEVVKVLEWSQNVTLEV